MEGGSADRASGSAAGLGAEEKITRRSSGILVLPHHGSGGCASWWPAAFGHPIIGLTVFPHGAPTPTTAGTGSPGATTDASGADGGHVGGGQRAVLKSVAQVEAEFNELLKRLYPPDLADEDPTELADDWADWQDRQRYRDDTTGPPRQSSLNSVPAQAGGARKDAAPAAAAWLGDAMVPGIGVIPASVIEEMSRSFGMTITRALVDADTGVTVETSETHYRPSMRLQQFVRTRDVHYRFPGCTRAARWCDIDHLTAWPGGPTSASNLCCLCRHHHRTKQENGWSVTMTTDGVCTWTSPSGRTYITTPAE